MSSSGRLRIGVFRAGVGSCLIVAMESATSCSSRVESMLVLELAVSNADELMVDGRDDCAELELMDRRKIPMMATQIFYCLTEDAR